MEFEEVLACRRSTRRFTAEPVDTQALETILRAGQQAPLAAGDDRTTHLTLVNAGELLETLRSTCFLRRKTGETVDAFYGAQALIVVSATELSEDHIEYANAGCVIENMHLQATALGLGSCYIWGCLRKLRSNKDAVAALRADDLETFFQVVINSGESSWKLLQNLHVATSDNQEMPLALEMSRRMLAGRGAWRIHGGGFAGTILAFVPFDALEAYRAAMDSVFGEKATTALSIRPEGVVWIK